MITDDRQLTFEERYRAMAKRRELDNRRRNHDRVRVAITCVNEPDPDDPAGFFYVLVKATHRLRQLMGTYKERYGLYGGFEDAPPNWLPQHGPQLQIQEWAFQEVLRCPVEDYYDGEGGSVEGLVDDFVHSLSGYYAQVTWRRN